MNATLLFIAVFMLAPMAIHAQPTPNPVIVFTKKSSTELTATVGGVDFGSVSLLHSPDHWTWLLPPDRPGVRFEDFSNRREYWLEPESTATRTYGNILEPTVGGSINGFPRGGISIVSELNRTGLENDSLPNGATSLDKVTFDYSDRTSETFSVQFIDLGDSSSSVPDVSSTLGMLFLSMAALFGATKIQRVRAD